MTSLSPMDPSSFSRPDVAVIKHVSLTLNVDFEQKILSGAATLNFDVLEETSELILDASNLNIELVKYEDGTTLEHKIDEPIPNFGSKLTITLPKPVGLNKKKDDCTQCRESLFVLEEGTTNEELPIKFTGFFYEPVIPPEVEKTEIRESTSVQVLSKMSISVDATDTEKSKPKNPVPVNTRDISIHDEACGCCECFPERGVYQGVSLKVIIKYSTAPTASALQWLDAAQTSGKEHPYLFSQCQPIHARSILPCQDTPAVKFTYDAEVTAPEHFTVLMSALRTEAAGNKTTFCQNVPIPSYLLAVAVGVLEYRSLGPRTLVWSEKEEIERSAWEFAETEKYIQAAERLCGPYQWTQYDLLVLPPSFPYGGMENPCLTFVTPTLLAGDRSQADVIVHEIMHSWTGNLVTNKNFEHFWLNEGFTVFLERKVGASLIANSSEAKKSRDFQSLLGLQELSETVIDFLGSQNPLTRLVPDLDGPVHPDDAFSRVPYEKGSLFLRYLEDLLGGPEVFDEFIRSYLEKFQRKSLDTDQFKAHLLEYFKDNEQLAAVDWSTWLYKSGMPPVIPNYDTSMTKSVKSLVSKFDQKNATFSYNDVSAFTPHQMINLLQELIDKEPMSVDQLRQIGTEFKIDVSKNSEILYRWLRLCIRSKDQSKLNEVFDFVNNQGRMKYVRPIYRDLYAWEDVRAKAIENFLKNEPNMMHVSAYTLRKDLHLSE